MSLSGSDSRQLLRPSRCSMRAGVVSKNAILAETDTWCRGLTGTFVADIGEYLWNRGFLAAKSSNSRSTRALQPRTPSANEPLNKIKPRGDSDGANRRLAQSRSPFLPMDARTSPYDTHSAFCGGR